MTRISQVRSGRTRPCFPPIVERLEDQFRFLDGIEIPGAGGRMAELARKRLREARDVARTGPVPDAVWDRLRGAMEGGPARLRDTALADRAFGDRASDYGSEGWGFESGRGALKYAPSRERLARVATVLDDADLEMVATNDVFWDEIASVDSIGEQTVYDATVPGTQNFVANGISLH